MSRFVLILLVPVWVSFRIPGYNKVKVNKNIIVQIPSDLVPVPPDEISSKFISHRTPLAVYTNMTTEVDLGINTSVSRWRDSDVELVKLFYKSNITSLYDEVQFLREEIKNINKRDFIIFEFISRVNPETRTVTNEPPVSKYTYIEYAVVRGTVYVFDFSSPPDQKDYWRPIIQKFMESVKIK